MNILFPKTPTERISLFIIWLFHFCGFLGIAYGNTEWFITFTPVNLMISFALLFVNQKEIESKNIIA